MNSEVDNVATLFQTVMFGRLSCGTLLSQFSKTVQNTNNSTTCIKSMSFYILCS